MVNQSKMNMNSSINDLKQKPKRVVWIDFAKFAAIIAVMVDHSWNILYDESFISFLSFYSVSLFIILMGVTSYKSCERKKYLVSNKLLGIIKPYLIASFIYDVFIHSTFNFERYVSSLIRFNGSEPFYFILLYIQLVFVCPVYYSWFQYSTKKRYPYLIELAALIVVIIISWWTTSYTNILSVYGGGGKLLGGTYLILLYIGMWFAKYYERKQLSKKQSIALLVVSFIFTAICAWILAVDGFSYDKYLPLGSSLNPPGVSLIVYAIFVFLFCYSLGTVMNFYENSVLAKVYNKISLLGRHTLYIFLYHRLFLDEIFPFFKENGISIHPRFLKRALYFPLIIAGCIAIEHVLAFLERKITLCYKQER